MTTEPASRRESLRHVGQGLAETAGVFVGASLFGNPLVASLTSAPHRPLGYLGFALGLLAAVGLGVWHWRRGERRVAYGVFAGIIVCPLVLTVLVVVAVGLLFAIASRS